MKLLDARIVHFDLVGNSPQKRLVRQVGWIEVGREDDELLERHLDLLARRNRQEVLAILQRDDPAIQQIGRLNALAAEVVDQQTAAIALQLQRRFTHVAHRIVADFQRVERQFATHDHRRPPDLDPAAIVIGVLQQALLVRRFGNGGRPRRTA